ncbi:MAG TPA: bifunctional phosphopantothenoylcysteine decarboxylase/phosphopantothenate--cysteine ligase CoaBC [Candidatus Limnocylindrales bacterium]|nr:bifunctional phosphopantothenoylcysteine decarboxylase/phosphopantothenate--cysteine ligase CoaBC [Candidatus Limnocylindrales bacterium]
MTGRLDGRLIGLGVTGSIAAYKAVELLRLLRAEGADVVAMLTPAATAFVGPLTFQALSRHAVETDVLALLPDGRIGHIVVADTADAIVVAPATAHWLGAMAHGLSGDVVTATTLATSAPVIVAPAMDGDMWTHPATRDNVVRLREDFGYTIVEPAAGELASGQSGVGRLADLPAIVDAVVAAIGTRPVRAADAALRPPTVEPVRDADLTSRHIVVSAGGTREAIDPVRFIGNRSTGKMGVAVAEAALARGARVTLVAANMDVAPPAGAATVNVESAAELRTALHKLTHADDGAAGFDALVMAAAVSDFRPATSAGRKIERGSALTLELEPTPDILGQIARIARGTDREGETTYQPLSPRPYLVGFAAETGSLERAAGKLQRKGIDLLVANDVAEAGSGFGTDTNRVTILDADGGRDELPMLPKRAVADRILDRVARALDDRDGAAQTG